MKTISKQRMIFLSALGLVFLIANAALGWISETWEISGYIGWEFLDVNREVVFYEESFGSSYPFVVQQKEHMEKGETILVSKLKELFGAFFTPLVIVAYRKNGPEDADFIIIDVACESDSRIYQGSKLGRFEYQYVNILRVSGVGAHFHVPSAVKYTSFWLLPSQSLTGKVYLHGHTSEKIDNKWNRFRIEVEQNELFLILYIEQLQRQIDEINQRVDELKKR